MNNVKMAFLVTLISGLSTLFGLIFIFLKKGNTKKFIARCLSFASGVMFAVSVFDLMPESFEFLSKNFLYGKCIVIIILFVLLGIFMSFFTSKYIPENNEVKGDKKLYKIGFISLVAIILHNIPEGIVTFIATNAKMELGFSLAFAIAMHNIPEGISIALPIYYGTNSKLKTFIFTFVAGISEFFGAFFAFLFLPSSINNIFMGIIFSVISGLMLHISLFELLPNSFNNDKFKYTLLFFTVGIFFIQIFVN